MKFKLLSIPQAQTKVIWNFIRKYLIKTIGIFVAIIFFVAALVAIFPDLQKSIQNKFYEWLDLRGDPVTIDHLLIDRMNPAPGFDFCPNGFFYELKETEPKPNQQFVKVEHNHSVEFVVNKNTLIEESVTIKNIYINILEVKEVDSSPFIAEVMGCGAGGDLKFYSVDEKDYVITNDTILPQRIRAKVADFNTEKFDYIVLNNVDSVDWIRLSIEAPVDMLIKFNVELDVEFGDEKTSIFTQDLYIARTEWTDKWDNNPDAVWEIKSQAREAAEYKKWEEERLRNR